jgi:arsenate reductase
MKEAGVDISAQASNLIEELPVKVFDYVITLCGHANETCPYFPGKKIHMGFDDPPKLAAAVETDAEKLVPYRRVRDEIRKFVEKLPEILAETSIG